MTTVTRDNWREKVGASGLTLIEVAARTGKSFSAVYAYSRGARTPSDAWIAACGEVLAEYAREWICPVCKTRNGSVRFSCKGCARAYDSYDPGILRPTSHGMAQ